MSGSKRQAGKGVAAPSVAPVPASRTLRTFAERYFADPDEEPAQRRRRPACSVRKQVKR